MRPHDGRMKDGTETKEAEPMPIPLDPKTPPTAAAMQLCRHCKQVLTESEAKAHRKGTGKDHDIVPYP